MNINIDCYATTDGFNYSDLGKASVNIDVPDNWCAVELGNTVNLAVRQAIALHQKKLAAIKTEQEHESQADHNLLHDDASPEKYHPATEVDELERLR